MNSLRTYIFESDDIETLKSVIISDIKNLDSDDEDDVKLIKRISNVLANANVSQDGILNKISSSGLRFMQNFLLRSFEHNNQLVEVAKLLEDDDNLISSKELITGDREKNIYDLMSKYNLNIDLLKELSTTKGSSNNVNKGDFEVLSQLFLKDITKDNKPTSGKNGDINTVDSGTIEYKVCGARLCGQGTLYSPSLIYRHLNSLLDKRYGKSDDIDWKTIINGKNKGIFCSQKNAQQFIKDVYNIYPKLTDDELNTMFAESLMYQFPQNDSRYNITDDDIKKFIQFVVNDCPIVKNKTYEIKNTQNAIGAMHIYFYQKFENWDYMMLFAKDKSQAGKINGKYVYISANDDMKSFKDIVNLFNTYNIKIDSAIKISQSREYASQIKYIKK